MVEQETQASLGGTVPVELRRSSEATVDWTDTESLSREWNRQSRDLAHRFAEKLGMSREKYIETLPDFEPIPEGFKSIEIPAVPIIVDPRVSWSDLFASDEEMAKLRQQSNNSQARQEQDFSHLRIEFMFGLEELGDWKEGSFQTPKDDSYVSWMTYRLNKSADEVRSFYKRNQHLRGGTALDSVFYYYRRPQKLGGLNMKLPGSQVGTEYVPIFSTLGGTDGGRPNYPRLTKGSIDAKSPKSACLVVSHEK